MRTVVVVALSVLMLALVPNANAHWDEVAGIHRCESFTFGGDIRAYHVRSQGIGCRTVTRYIRWGEPPEFECAWNVTDNGREILIYRFRCRDGDMSFKFSAA